MKGQDVGSLAVLLRTSFGNGPADFFVIANITGTWLSADILSPVNMFHMILYSPINWLGEQGDFWEKHTYELVAPQRKTYEVIVEGRVGSGHRGDIAIDDITLSRGCERSDTEIPGHPTDKPPTSGITSWAWSDIESIN